MDNANLAEHPERTHAIIGLALNLCYLLASLSSPYMPSTATSITEQLNAPLANIPDKWSPGALAGGHKIGKAAYLFTIIKPEKENEWQELYGGTQASRLLAEEEKAKKAADKVRDKERKKARKEAAKSAEKGDNGAAADSKVELPLRGVMAEEQAPPPASGL